MRFGERSVPLGNLVGSSWGREDGWKEGGREKQREGETEGGMEGRREWLQNHHNYTTAQTTHPVAQEREIKGMLTDR